MFDPAGVVDLNAAAYRGFGTPGYSRSSPSGTPSAGMDLMLIPPKTAKNLECFLKGPTFNIQRSTFNIQPVLFSLPDVATAS